MKIVMLQKVILCWTKQRLQQPTLCVQGFYIILHKSKATTLSHKEPNKGMHWEVHSMKSAWIAYSLVLGSLLLAAPEKLAARGPKLQNPCHDLKDDLDDQVNSLHRRLDDELAQCRQAQGKNSDVCRDLKEQQKAELQRLRDQRQVELQNCNPNILRASRTHFPETQTESCNSETYRHDKNDKYPDGKYHEPPYKHNPQYPSKDPSKGPPSAYNPPPKYDGGDKHHHDSDAGGAKSAGNSGGSGYSHSGGPTSHSGGSSSASGGSGVSSGSSSSHSGGGYSSGGSSGSSAGSSAHSSGGSSSGSSASSSSSSSSSASTTSNSGGHPK
jgi:uncharacterized membrane protein YgcG